MADKFLNAAGLSKAGNDTIFSWWARFQEAKSSGLPAVNGTIGALLEDDGQLAINKAVDAAIEASARTRNCCLCTSSRPTVVPRFIQIIGLWRC